MQLISDASIDPGAKDNLLAGALVNKPSEAAIAALVALMQSDPAPANANEFNAGFYAASILAAIGDSVLSSVKELANASASPIAHVRCCHVLAELKTDEAVPVLGHLLRSSSSEVQQAAAVALGQHGGAGARDLLLAVQTNDSEVIKAVEWALTELPATEG